MGRRNAVAMQPRVMQLYLKEKDVPRLRKQYGAKIAMFCFRCFWWGKAKSLMQYRRSCRVESALKLQRCGRSFRVRNDVYALWRSWKAAVSLQCWARSLRSTRQLRLRQAKVKSYLTCSIEAQRQMELRVALKCRAFLAKSYLDRRRTAVAAHNDRREAREREDLDHIYATEEIVCDAVLFRTGVRAAAWSRRDGRDFATVIHLQTLEVMEREMLIECFDRATQELLARRNAEGRFLCKARAAQVKIASWAKRYFARHEIMQRQCAHSMRMLALLNCPQKTGLCSEDLSASASRSDTIYEKLRQAPPPAPRQVQPTGVKVYV
jgi:hypothetical protein